MFAIRTRSEALLAYGKKFHHRFNGWLRERLAAKKCRLNIGGWFQIVMAGLGIHKYFCLESLRFYEDFPNENIPKDTHSSTVSNRV